MSERASVATDHVILSHRIRGRWQSSHNPVDVPRSPARHGINNFAAVYLMLSDRDAAACGVVGPRRSIAAGTSD
jgi:hypothetical protein